MMPPPPPNFEDYVLYKVYHLTSFLEHVSPLAADAFGCYSVLITLPLIFIFYVIKAVKVELEQFKLAT